MAKFYYNGVLLPELPNPADIDDFLSNHKYFHITKQTSKSDESFNYILYVSSGEWMYGDSEYGFVIGTVGSSEDILIHVAVRYNLINDEWIVDEEHSPECPFTYFISTDDEYLYDPIWFSHDVPIIDTNTGEHLGGVYMTASEPIPEDEYNPGGGDTIFDGDVAIDSECLGAIESNIFDSVNIGDILNIKIDSTTYSDAQVKELSSSDIAHRYVGNKYLVIKDLVTVYGSVEEVIENYPWTEMYAEDTGESFFIFEEADGSGGITGNTGIMLYGIHDTTVHLTITTGSNTGDTSDPQVILHKSALTDIADAIREKTGKTDKMYLSQMPEEIEGIVGRSLLADVIEGDEEVAVSSELVTNVGSYAFYNHSGVTSVDFPNCETIGNSAFYDCKSLTEANFPVCTSIGNHAFDYCLSLTSINFPNCTTINNSAFARCSKLTTAIFSNCTTVGTNAFGGCSKLATISFPICITIGYSGFAQCKTLTTADFPSCTTIGYEAFLSCSSLNEINFPVCTSIGSKAFMYCSSLTSANFPNCTYIGSYAFGQCRNLATISFPACTTIIGYAFAHCSSLTTADFPACTKIGALYAFNSCIGLTSVNLPVCSSIGSYTFDGCTGLTTVTFPACTYIGAGAFRSCTTLTTINLSICKSIVSNVFVNCISLTSLTLGTSSVASLANVNAFYSTPMSVSTYTGSFGSIYVPASLVDSYKAASNWSVYADRITAIVE